MDSMGFCQDLALTHFEKENGLSSNSVLCVTQDQQGFLWIGTINGLNKYDGYRFTKFVNQQEDSTSISDNFINDIFVSPTGSIWLATNGGLNELEPQTGAFKTYRRSGNNPDDRVAAVTGDRDGNIWSGTRFGLEKLDPASGEYRQFRMDSSILAFPWYEVSELAEASGESQNGLLVGTWGAGAYLFQEETGEFQALEFEGHALPIWVNDFYQDFQGKIWAVVNSANVYQYDPVKRHFSTAWTEPNIPGRDMHAIFVGADKEIYVGRGGTGISIIDPDLGTSRDFLLHDASFDLHFNWVKSIFRDREGGLWMGKLNGGLSRFVPRSLEFKVFRHRATDPESLSDNYITSILETSQGEMWIATRRHGLNILSDQGVFKPFEEAYGQTPTREIMCLFEDNDHRIWVGSWGMGMWVYSPGTKRFHHFNADPLNSQALCNPFIEDIMETSEGELWIATAGGISILDLENWQAGSFRHLKYDDQDPDGLSFPRTTALLEDRDGFIWVGTDQGGINLFDRKLDGFIHFHHDPYDPKSLSNDRIRDIFQDRDGGIWFATDGGGLNLLEKDQSGFIHFTSRDGLASDEVMGITSDQTGHMWISTGFGLSSFDPSGLKFENYYQYDGLAGNDMASQSIIYSPATHKIWCGSRNGLSVFDPLRLSRNEEIPPVVIQSVYKYNSEGMPQLIPLDRQKEQYPGVRLSYEDRIVTIEFAALSFNHPARNLYAYKLEGYNDEWIHLGTRREVTFTSLPPGNYTFHVRGSNDDEVWNEKGASILLVVDFPWWRRWWSVTAVVCVLAGLGYLLLRYWNRRNSEKEESRRLKYLNEAMSEFIATVSHELRTPLTSIRGFSQIVKKRLQDRIFPFTDLSDEKRVLTSNQIISNMDIVVKESERLTMLINDLLDLSRIESGKIDLQLEPLHLREIVNVAKERTETIFLEKEMALDIQIKGELPLIYADRNRILQVMINLLSNAVKFSNVGTVFCSASCDGEYVQVAVRDQGTGIPAENLTRIFEKFSQLSDNVTMIKPRGTGLGLPISREIIQQHGGKMWVESTVREGSVFYFTLPVYKE